MWCRMALLMFVDEVFLVDCSWHFGAVHPSGKNIMGKLSANVSRSSLGLRPPQALETMFVF